MINLRLMSAAMMTVALLAAPAMAREGQLTSHMATANAGTATSAHSRHEQCCRSRASDLRGLADRDVWGHWGSYYGPMAP
jgi:predicted transglutaminase-like cysteine proteinase